MLQNFPYKQEDLLPVSQFVSYCKDRGIKANEKLLELFHKKGLLYPCVRVFPGIIVFIKAKLKEHNGEERFIAESDVGKFKKPNIVSKTKYYHHGGISYGKDDWLYWYIDKGMVDYPIEDKKFKSWSQCSLKEASFTINKKALLNYRMLFYSKYQIHILNYILKWRTQRFNFHNTLNQKKILELSKIINIKLDTFDTYFIKDKYNEFILFFKILLDIKDLFLNSRNKVINEIDQIKDDEPSLNKSHKDFDKKEYQNELNERFKIHLENGTKSIKKKYKIEEKYLEEWRLTFLHDGFNNHEGFNFYQIIKPDIKTSKFLNKGKPRYLLDCIEIAEIIEKLFDFSGYKYTHKRELYWNSNKYKLCTECHKTFEVSKFHPGQKVCTNRYCQRKANTKSSKKSKNKG
jgi:hypothetical protein